ncbi:MAG: clan AA aspartic protease [Candidatus Sumerlaeota bacterium]|nr:clan AA aspartic protease [Candidatus Sumerlaeota bacterium]
MVREGFMAPDRVRHCQTEAVVGENAIYCMMPAYMADSLGLSRPLRQVAEYADGRKEEVDVTEPVLIEIEGRKVFEECLVLGDEMLIGQAALNKMDLRVDCREQRLRPNPAHPLQSIVKVKQMNRRGTLSMSVTDAL